MTQTFTAKQWEGRSLRMKQKRRYHGAVLLHDDRILMTGGRNGRHVLGDHSSGAVAVATVAVAEIVNIANSSRNSTISSTIIPPRISRSDHTSVYINTNTNANKSNNNYNHAYAYVIGGFDGLNKLKSVERINVDVPSPRWEAVADMNYARRGCAAAASTHQDKLFVFGGYDENGTNVPIVEYLDITASESTSTRPNEDTKINNKWTVIAGSQMKIPRYDHAAVTVGNRIYVIGGIDSNGNKLTGIEIFDTTTKSFVGDGDDGSALPIPMSSMSAVVLDLELEEENNYDNKYILITGGKMTDNHVIGESYFLNTSNSNAEWQIINVPLQTPRYGHAAVLMNNGTIIVCGGRGSDHIDLDSIETISSLDLIPRETLINDYRNEFSAERGYEIVDDNGLNVYIDEDDDDENANDSGDCFGICNILKQLFIHR